MKIVKHEEFVRLRQDGHSLKELSSLLKISLSTASLWGQTVQVSEHGQQRLRARATRGSFQKGKQTTQHLRLQARRNDAFEEGAASNISPQDALCLGLYWGEGAKSEKQWAFTNSDPQAVAQMLQWAIRAGQPREGFKAWVHLHEGNSATDPEVLTFWAATGIPCENIFLLRVKHGQNSRRKNRLPFGTCQLRPIKNGAKLFSYYEGQKSALVKHP